MSTDPWTPRGSRRGDAGQRVPSFAEGASTGDGTRVDAIAAHVAELDARLGAAELAAGDEKTAKELRKAIEAVAKHEPKLEERLTNRVDVLADRLNTLATTVSTTAAALAGKDGEIVGLRRQLECEHMAVEALASEIRGPGSASELDELRRTVAELVAHRPKQAGDKRVAELSAKVDFLAERVDTLATTVATTAAGLAGREGEVTALRRSLAEDLAHLQRALGDLRAGGEDALASQIRSLSAAVASTAADLAQRKSETAELRALVDDGQGRLDAAVADLRHVLAAAIVRFDGLESAADAEVLRSLEREVAETGARIAVLSTRLDSLGTAVEAAGAAAAEKEQELATLGHRFEHASTTVDALVRDLREAIATMPSPASESPAIAAEIAELEARVTDLTERLTSVTRDRGAAAAELARATAFWSTELSSIEGRFDALGARLESLARSDEAMPAPAAWAGGDGRFRLELRALELRMEHAEAAARESREAVLTQLERFSSRIDWLPQRPEAQPEPTSSAHEPQVEAQVVSIRATDS